MTWVDATLIQRLERLRQKLERRLGWLEERRTDPRLSERTRSDLERQRQQLRAARDRVNELIYRLQALG